MLLVTSLLRWWYGDGWRQRAQVFSSQLDGTIDYFSFSLLLKTFFSPFRQISAGRVDGAIGVQMRALADKLFSRLIGAFVRLFLMLIGGIVIGFQAIFGLMILVLWAVVPAFPIIGLGVVFTGWSL